MLYNTYHLRKMNEFLGRSPYTPFTKEEADATYIAWRNSITERDNARFTEAMQTAPKGSWVVCDNWQVGSSTIRRGQVVYCYQTKNIYGHIMICSEKSRQTMMCTCCMDELRRHASRVY